MRLLGRGWGAFQSLPVLHAVAIPLCRGAREVYLLPLSRWRAGALLNSESRDSFVWFRQKMLNPEDALSEILKLVPSL